MTALEFESLQHDIGELRAQRDQLVDSLGEEIARLRTAGAAVSNDVLNTVGRYRRHYLATRQHLIEGHAVLGMDRVASLDTWEQVLLQARRLQQVTSLLDEVDAWKIRGSDAPGPLTIVRTVVAELRQRMQEDPNQSWDDLLSGRHPLVAARTLIHQDGELSDEEWAELLDRVQAGYGRELTTAISRGKVLVQAAIRDQRIEVLT